MLEKSQKTAISHWPVTPEAAGSSPVTPATFPRTFLRFFTHKYGQRSQISHKFKCDLSDHILSLECFSPRLGTL